ncbi:hypothetical protein I7I48_07406 [Histoplasma ohiense]|nr:hypothetical protein I7I48_07406 [Histoplasma ohiense (nom. inval.)]
MHHFEQHSSNAGFISIAGSLWRIFQPPVALIACFGTLSSLSGNPSNQPNCFPSVMGHQLFAFPPVKTLVGGKECE